MCYIQYILMMYQLRLCKLVLIVLLAVLFQNVQLLIEYEEEFMSKNQHFADTNTGSDGNSNVRKKDAQALVGNIKRITMQILSGLRENDVLLSQTVDTSTCKK